ncbi:MAG TPA: DUF2442 domain-containing protein [Rhizomicrobium sp.]|jgi:hypothetical protein
MSEYRFPASMPNKVTKIEPLSGFRLRIHFKDGAWGEHDFADMMKEPGPMLDPLRDPAYFARVHLDHGAPTWPNEYDMCPDWVRMTLEEAGELRANAAAE